MIFTGGVGGSGNMKGGAGGSGGRAIGGNGGSGKPRQNWAYKSSF